MIPKEQDYLHIVGMTQGPRTSDQQYVGSTYFNLRYFPSLPYKPLKHLRRRLH